MNINVFYGILIPFWVLLWERPVVIFMKKI